MAKNWFNQFMGTPTNPVSQEAHSTIRDLLGGEQVGGVVSPQTTSPDSLKALIWAIPGDGYARVQVPLTKERNRAEVYRARGRGRSITISRADTTDWELSVGLSGDPIPGSELPVGSIIKLRGFDQVFVTNRASNGLLVLLVETSSLEV